MWCSCAGAGLAQFQTTARLSHASYFPVSWRRDGSRWVPGTITFWDAEVFSVLIRVPEMCSEMRLF